MNQNISNSEILHSGFTIFRRDRSDRGGGGVLIALKTASFKAVKEFKPESEAELQRLELGPPVLGLNMTHFMTGMSQPSELVASDFIKVEEPLAIIVGIVT